MVDNEVRIISVIFQKFKSYKKPDINEWAYRLLLERLNKYLEVVNFENYKKLNPLDYGLLMIDSVEPKFDMKIRRHILEFYERGSYYQDNQFLIEDPIFIKSHFRNLSQLADLSAFLARRYYDMKKPVKAKHRISKSGHYLEPTVNALFEELVEKAYDQKNGKVLNYGIKIFPSK